jgi:hypothetical protein
MVVSRSVEKRPEHLVLQAIVALAVLVLSGLAPQVGGPVGSAVSTRAAVDLPPPLWAAALAYDSKDGFTVLWGGNSGNGTGNYDQTWTFLHGDWRELHPTISPPGSSYTPDLAYDAADGYILLYEIVGTLQPQTWKFAGGNWTNLTRPAPAGPPNLFDSTMAYDAADHSVVLFGVSGYDDSLSQTWTFSGGRWTNRTATAGQAPRYGGVMALDSGRGALVYLGGGGELISNSSGVYCGGTWLFRNGSWASTNLPGPCGEEFPVMAFDEQTSQLILFGGGGGECDTIPCNSTWVLAPAGWRYEELTPSPNLDSLALACMAYDGADNYLVLYGGAAGGIPSDRTWTFQNGTWRELSLPPPAPSNPGISPHWGIPVAIGVAAVVVGILWRRRRKAAEQRAPPWETPKLGA